MRIRICGLLLWLMLMQASKGLALDTQSEQYRQLEEECGVYTYYIVKPMLEYFKQVNPKISRNGAELENKNNRIKELEEKLKQMEITIQKLQKDSVEETTCNQLCGNENKKIREVTTNAILDSKDLFSDVDKVMLELVAEETTTEQQIETKKTTNCLSMTPAGVHNITLGNGFNLEVLSNSDIAGPGWIIIQQRIRGGVDFYRDWGEYRNGFGDFWDGDFFLGLEKIHQLTNEEAFELYIHMQRFDGEILIARYDEFAISAAYDNYRLDLGEFSGNTSDQLSYHKNKRFTTYESTTCTKKHHGGWWYDNCAKCNLNGRYYKTGRWAAEGIFWGDWIALKEVRMMIRSKSECF